MGDNLHKHIAFNNDIKSLSEVISDLENLVKFINDGSESENCYIVEEANLAPSLSNFLAKGSNEINALKERIEKVIEELYSMLF